MAVRGINGLRVLVVEDESLISMMIEDTLTGIGCTVAGAASRLDEALSKVASLDFDFAILDVNLNGSQTYPVAEALAAKGIPFMLATGYGTRGVPDSLRDVPVLAKPFREKDLVRVLTAALD